MAANWDTMTQAIREARTVMNLADQMANACASLLVGRLRHVDGRTLKQLKAELRGFDAAGYSGRGWSQ